MTADARAALAGAAFAILAVPAQPLAAVLAALPQALPPLIVAAKGVEQGTLRLPLETVAALRPGLPGGVLTGPTFAHEVAAGLPAAALVAAADPALPALVLPRPRLVRCSGCTRARIRSARRWAGRQRMWWRSPPAR